MPKFIDVFRRFLYNTDYSVERYSPPVLARGWGDLETCNYIKE